MSAFVHIVDDDRDVRASLCLLVEALGYKVKSYDSGEMFLAATPKLDFSIILLDIKMPGRDGMEILRLIRQQSQSAKIIMMTGHGDIPLAVKAMQAGANDFIEKPFEAQRIKSVLEGCGAQEGSGHVLERLTPRERETAMLLSNGLPNKEVAFRLGISPRTVEVHRARIMSKLTISSPAELVRLMLNT